MPRRSAAGADRSELLSGYAEVQVWPQLRSQLAPDEARRIGEKIAEGKKTAPARPHPHTPASPCVLKGAGPAVAAADRHRPVRPGCARLA